MKEKKHLCIIDDDQVYQFTIRKTLELHQTFTRLSFFSDGREGIDFIKSVLDEPDRLPDTILLDLNMPILDGWGFMEEFAAFKKDLAKEVEIYLVTSSIDYRDRDRAAKFSEVTDFKVKPITFEDLEKIIHEVA